MKYWLLVCAIFISTLIKAQFGFYTQAGGNYSIFRVTRSEGVEHTKNRLGGQIGFGVEYHFQNNFFTYLETDIQKQGFKKDSTSGGFKSIVSKYNYTPLFINLPFGFGYQFANKTPINFKIYAGITTQIGVAGKLKYRSTSYEPDSVTGQPIQVSTTKDNHTLNYGRSRQLQNEFQSDLANTIWGINVGGGITFYKRFEVDLFYQEGLNNILPGGDGAPEVNKLRSITLNVKFYFPKRAYDTSDK